MRRLALTCVLAVAGAALALPASASAPSDTDLLCTHVSVPHPEGTRTGVLSGGPIARNGHLACTLQVGHRHHADPGYAAQASATGTGGVTVLSPTTVSYAAAPGQSVYVCDEFTDADGDVYVYDADDDTWEAASGNATAACREVVAGVAESANLRSLVESMCALLRQLGLAMNCPPYALIGDVTKPFIDPHLCPRLAPQAGVYGAVAIMADGDFYLNGQLLWDCPPHGV